MATLSVHSNSKLQQTSLTGLPAPRTDSCGSGHRQRKRQNLGYDCLIRKLALTLQPRLLAPGFANNAPGSARTGRQSASLRAGTHCGDFQRRLVGVKLTVIASPGVHSHICKVRLAIITVQTSHREGTKRDRQKERDRDKLNKSGFQLQSIFPESTSETPECHYADG